MIISVSRRTDIPALYSNWFINRIEEGYAYVRNPMNIHQISKIDLSPEVVDCIVFWTKNAGPLLHKLNCLEKYKYYFQYTITNYPKEVEPNIPSISESLSTFKSISNIIGKRRIIWRYDPIILTNIFDVSWHINNFQYLCENLAKYTDKCVISFVDYYKNTKSNLSEYNYIDISQTEMENIAYELHNIAKKYNLRMDSCAESIDLNKIGIEHGKCIDDKLIEEIINCNLNIVKDKNQRNECGCVASIDLGAYNTCTNGCLYCYANMNNKMANINNISHDEHSPILFGNIEEIDKISIRKCVSCKVYQNDLFK